MEKSILKDNFVDRGSLLVESYKKHVIFAVEAYLYRKFFLFYVYLKKFIVIVTLKT